VNVPLVALLVFVAWTLLLLMAIGGVRVSQVLAGKAKANEFPAGVPHGGDRYWRLNRAHLNCLEFLPLFATVVLVGAVAGAGGSLLDNLARLIVVARVGQSLAHISSGSVVAVNVRFSFFAVQLASLVVMGIAVARAVA
jgi:hypothetical protein